MTKYLIEYTYTLAGKDTTLLVKNQNGSVCLFNSYGEAEDEARAIVRRLHVLKPTFKVLPAA